MFSVRLRAGLAGLVLILCASTAAAQTTPALSGTASGLAVSLSWTAVPGATGYDLIVSLNNSAPLPLAVGNITALNVPGVPPGTYVIAVRATLGAIAGPPSTPLTLTVAATPPPPPAPPANLAAAVSGNSVLLTWDLPAPNGLLGLLMRAGTSPGASDLGLFPIRVSNSSFLTVPNGNYFLSLLAVNAGGPSAPSNEVTLAVPSCIPPASLPLASTGQGNIVQLSWPQIPGAAGYRLDVASTPGGGANLTSQQLPATETGFQLFGAPAGTYYVTLHAALSCGSTVSSPEVVLNVTAPVRLPAKSFNQATGMVAAAGASTAGVGSSCGNNTWLFRTLQKLRAQDDRFGLNWKRGVVGDMSQDVILYNFSDLPNEQAGAAQVYAWDVIGGHCGGSPRPQAGNITDARGRAGWTILYYQRAGYAP